jgi:hypothetical protein
VRQQEKVFSVCDWATHTSDLHRNLLCMIHIHGSSHTHCGEEQCEVIFKGKDSQSRERQKQMGLTFRVLTNASREVEPRQLNSSKVWNYE